MKLRPLDDKVVIRRKDAESMTPGGLYLPDKAKTTPREGTVIAVGPGRLLENGIRAELQVKVGDKVLFIPYAGHDCDCDGVDHLIMVESDILAVLDSQDPAPAQKVVVPQRPVKKGMVPGGPKKRIMVLQDPKEEFTGSHAIQSRAKKAL